MTNSHLAVDRVDDFKDFCSEVFATLGRVDQRRAGETYLYGLLNCTGRKSIRQLAATEPGRSEQSLQQFINQSPWDPDPIRQRLMSHLVRQLRPTAWAIEEVAFPKHGRYSAAVDRQYVQSLGRVCNCQLAITVTLTAGGFSVPVNWRLVVPDSWGRDTTRRERARMPEHELPRPYWQYQIEVLDHMALEWGMPSAPILVDTMNRGGVEGFLGALEMRHLPYLAQVSPNLTVWCDHSRPRPVRGGYALSAPSGSPTAPPWRGTVSELVSKIGNAAPETVEWRNDDNSILRSQFQWTPIRLMTTPHDSAARTPLLQQQPRHLLISEWPLGKSQPRGFWITNIVDRPLSSLVALAKLRHLVGPRIDRFANRFGLRDYEGRTFAGWHHHVTLATAAYTYHVLDTLRANGASQESLLQDSLMR